MATIRVTGVADNHRTPGGYAEILFQQGPANAALGPRLACVVGPKTAAGTATANVLYAIPDEGTAALLAGTGAPAHRVARKYLEHGAASALSMVTYTPKAGTAASLSTAITGAPTKRGQADAQVGPVICSYGFSTSDTASSVADGLEAAINGATYLPATCAAYHAATGTGITVTAKVHGTSQNTAIRLRTDVTAGAGVAIAAGGDLAGGVGDDSTPLTTALAAINTIRRYYVGVPISDATLGALLKTHIVNKSQPNPGLRSVGIMGGRGTLTDTTTIANGLNCGRIQYVHQEDSDHDPAELVGEIMGIRSEVENTDSSANMAGRGVNLHAAYDIADRPTSDEINTAINEGITEIASTESGAYIAMSVNTCSKNAAGTVNDFRATETHRVSVPDDAIDTILQTWALNFQGKKFADDKRDAKGLVDPNQVYKSTVAKPSMVRKMVAQVLRQFEDDDKLQNVDASIAALVAQKSAVNSGRTEVGVNFHTIDHAHQLVVLGKETSTG
jgi:phage tail sheath gpL-like